MQRTQYYPSGLPIAYNPDDNPGLQKRKYNGKEFVEMHGYDTYDYGARGMYPAIGGFATVNPLAEKYPWCSPYVYCLDNPINHVDPDGRDPKNIHHWVRFAKEVVKATTLSVSVGLQVSVKAKIGTKPVGIDLNAASIDLVSLRDGKISPNAKRPQIQKNAAIGIGVVGAEYSKEIKDNGATTTVETKRSAGLVGMSREHVTAQNYVERSSGEMIPITPSKSETHNKVDDIGSKSGLIVVGEWNLNTEKIAKALGHLIKDK